MQSISNVQLKQVHTEVYKKKFQELDLSHRADTSLLNFCEWQHREQEKSGGKKADHSILLTGIDICVNKNKPCGTLGWLLFEV